MCVPPQTITVKAKQPKTMRINQDKVQVDLPCFKIFNFGAWSEQNSDSAFVGRLLKNSGYSALPFCKMSSELNGCDSQ